MTRLLLKVDEAAPNVRFRIPSGAGGTILTENGLCLCEK